VGLNRAWFQHVLAAPLLPRAARAVQGLLEREIQAQVPAGASEHAEQVEFARQAVAGLLRARPQDVILTSGGTEAANLAIKGRARAVPGRLLTSGAEHTSLLYPMRSLEREKFEVVRIPVDAWGRWNREAVAREARQGATLLSVQHANHELGTLQPVEDLVRETSEAGIPIHLDAVVSAGLARLDVRRLGVDLLSFSGSRLGALGGTGVLWVRPGLRILPQLEGGTQESGRRGGSENLVGLATLAVACQEATGREEARWAHTGKLRDALEEGLKAAVPGMVVNSPPPAERLPGHLHVSFPGAEGEALVHRLRRRGVDVSTGSACTGEAGKPSHVLEACGIPRERSRCSLLFSLGPSSRPDDVRRALETVPEVVGELRRLGPAAREGVLDPPPGLA
jgi:cysteine desulfurase